MGGVIPCVGAPRLDDSFYGNPRQQAAGGYCCEGAPRRSRGRLPSSPSTDTPPLHPSDEPYPHPGTEHSDATRSCLT